jgi:hypothetical protein
LAQQATLFGSRGSHLELHGIAAVSLAVAYIAVGAFAHFHWFWGLHHRLQQFSDVGKLLSLVVFLPSFGYAIFQIFSSFAI